MRQISGTHLLIDGYVEDDKTLEPEAICDLFDRLVEALDMEYLQRPTAMRVSLDPSKLSSDEDEGGWSVIAQITTSHIAIHTWPLRSAFSMDVFSCKEFNADAAKALIYDTLRVDTACSQVIERRGPLQE